MILLKNFFLNILNKKVNNLNKFSISSLYIIFIILIISISTAFYLQFILLYPDIIDLRGNIIYKNIPFEYGSVIENLISKDKYFAEIGIMGNSIEFYLSRMPVLPYLFLLAKLFSSNLYFFIVSKNVIFGSIIFFTILNFSKEKSFNCLSFLIIILIFFYNPFNLKIITNFVYADFITSILIPVLFIICLSNFKLKDYYIGLIIFILYLSKTSMFFICIFISIYFLLFESKKIPFYFLLMAIILWGTFGFIKTNKFPFGPSMLSTNSHALSISFNENFHKFYPLISVDYIPHCNIRGNLNKYNCNKIPKKIENEWDYYNFYKIKNSQYIKENLDIFLKDLILKIKTIFFNFYEDGQIYSGDNQPKKKFLISIFINKVILIIAVIVLIRSFFNKFQVEKNKKEILFFIIIISSMPAYLIGWALSRHLVYIFLVSKIYLFLKFKSKLL
tara:strand:- start:125 stop:1462 length:1338 start_codon:yes stop_codon:yes gene_type:complete